MTISIRSGNHIQPLITGEVKFVRDTNKSTPITKWDEHRSGTASWPQVKVEGNNKPSPKQPRLVTLLCGALGLDSVDKLDIVKRQINQVLADAWNVLEEKKLLTRVTATILMGITTQSIIRMVSMLIAIIWICLQKIQIQDV